MALTKHQKLARAMKCLLNALETHHQKTAHVLNILQFHFFPTHFLIGCPLMSERKLRAMMRTHLCGLVLFSPNKALQLAAQHSPLIGFILAPLFYPQSRILPPNNLNKNEKVVIPWGVKIFLPLETLQNLEDAKLEALLYCAAEDEMSEWIDWFQNEDEAASLTNQLLSVGEDFQEKTIFEKNVQQRAMPFYQESIVEFHKLPKGKPISQALLKADFAPQEESDIGTAYKLISGSLANHRKRHFEDFQRFWRDQLTNLMFKGLDWDGERRQTFLAECFFPSEEARKTNSTLRWETSSTLDRQTYGSFLCYFLNRFISDPIKFQADGEISLLLWIMIYATRNFAKPPSIKKLLTLTTAAISDRYATIDGSEIELSLGLADLLREYIGQGNLKRQQKLFPNLTIDKLEDHLHRASAAVLPPGALPALPEAFLTFPHIHKNCRMHPKLRRQQQLERCSKKPYSPISLKELKQQLVKKSRPS